MVGLVGTACFTAPVSDIIVELSSRSAAWQHAGRLVAPQHVNGLPVHRLCCHWDLQAQLWGNSQSLAACYSRLKCHVQVVALQYAPAEVPAPRQLSCSANVGASVVPRHDSMPGNKTLRKKAALLAGDKLASAHVTGAQVQHKAGCVHVKSQSIRSTFTICPMALVFSSTRLHRGG